jgi:hypothetical protein
MTTNSQKESEKIHLEKALNLAGILNYTLVDKDGESPDFLIEIDDEVIGIEVTQIYRRLNAGNAIKAERDNKDVRKQAIKIYNEKGGIPVIFYFVCDGRASIVDKKDAAKKLGVFIYEYMMNNFPNGIINRQEIDLKKASDDLLSFINFIHVVPTNDKQATDSLFSTFDTKELTDLEIEETVRKKEKRLPSYLKRCKKIWLLIVLPSMRTTGDLRIGSNNIKFNHAFDCVYVFDEYNNDLITIEKA